ncbi:MAG: polysaccharide deacetylase family protein [Anaerolineae bacterium]|nr:polysaccharide deacetylase family protein [Anaerolineae bacterium]
MMNPVITALRGKGPLNFVYRVGRILANYGTTAHRQDKALGLLFERLAQLECPATFPVVSTILQRNAKVLSRYPSGNLEFAVHGYAHTDYTRLTYEEQTTHLTQAKHIFHSLGMAPKGFRAPYLRFNRDTLTILQQLGFSYDSSQGLNWDVIGHPDPESYRRVLSFYGALSAETLPSLPSIEGSLVRIPYCLPDDESLVQRLGLHKVQDISAIWHTILHRTYQLGEVFTLGIHPERTTACLASVNAVLTEARQFSPQVWIANLGEIAHWWRTRTETRIRLENEDNHTIRIALSGPHGLTVLLRDVESSAPSSPWTRGYRCTWTSNLTVRSPLRPFIAVAPGTAPTLTAFLKQQGYIVEVSTQPETYAYYFDQTDFDATQQRGIVKSIEEVSRPLVRLGRWPAGAKSALCITGDIDAMTIWDYVARFVGT